MIITGDCLLVMQTIESNTIDTIITDPPYALSGKHGLRSPQYGEGGKKNYGERVGGFMGMDWDAKIPGVEVWAEALRVAKPGAHLLAFGGRTTHHRLMCAIEDAGWELRDTFMWLYGSGMPKSHNVSKGIDKAAGVEREVVGHGRGMTGARAQPHGGGLLSDDNYQWPGDYEITAPSTGLAKLFDGYGTGIRPSWEPIVMAMKPREGTYANNAAVWGVAGLNIDAARYALPPRPSQYVRPHQKKGNKGSGGWKNTSKKTGSMSDDWKKGGWPPDVLLDPEAADLLEQQNPDKSQYFPRFHYSAKASRREKDKGLDEMPLRPGGSMDGNSGRSGQRTAGDHVTPIEIPQVRNTHKTVKPVSLMVWLCHLTKTPTGGVVLDPFMGSGTTGIACVKTGRKFIGIEAKPEYVAIAAKRIACAQAESMV